MAAPSTNAGAAPAIAVQDDAPFSSSSDVVIPASSATVAAPAPVPTHGDVAVLAGGSGVPASRADAGAHEAPLTDNASAVQTTSVTSTATQGQERPPSQLHNSDHHDTAATHSDDGTARTIDAHAPVMASRPVVANTTTPHTNTLRRPGAGAAAAGGSRVAQSSSSSSSSSSATVVATTAATNANANAVNAGNADENVTLTPSPSLLRPFPWPLSPKQLFYILGTQSIGAAIVDAGANFGVAYAMYHNQFKGPGGSGKIVSMWWFNQNTIAGDLGVTPIIQVGASMLITSTLVHTDLHHHMIRPLPFVWPHVEHLPDPRGFWKSFKARRTYRQRSTTTTMMTSVGGGGEKVPQGHEQDKDLDLDDALLRLPFYHYYWLMLLRFLFEGTEHNMLLTLRGGFLRGFLWRIGWTALQGIALGVFFGLPLWCLFIVILGPIYGTDGDLGNKWVPQIVKAVYGGFLGLVTNPVIATLALGSQAEHNLLLATAAAEEDVDADPVNGGAGDGDLEKGQRATTLQPVSTKDVPDRQRRLQGGAEADEELLASPPPLRIPSSSSPTASYSRPGGPARRARATSSVSIASSSSRRRRPSLTADASRMDVLPPQRMMPTPQELETETMAPFASSQEGENAAATPSESGGLAPPLPLFLPSTPPPPPSPRPPRRPRAYTASSQHSSYSYSLGGTGGRAQRPHQQRARAASRASQMSSASVGVGVGHDNAAAAAAAAAGLGVNGGAPSTPGATTTTREGIMRARTPVLGVGVFDSSPGAGAATTRTQLDADAAHQQRTRSLSDAMTNHAASAAESRGNIDSSSLLLLNVSNTPTPTRITTRSMSHATSSTFDGEDTNVRPGTADSGASSRGGRSHHNPMIAPLRLPAPTSASVPATRVAAAAQLDVPRESMELRAERRGEL